jgi:L-ascorbate metabolism protein UlaG (beta-lactamase superfamily)
LNNINEQGISPLISAVREGNVGLVQMLLDNGARADIKENRYGMTALHSAAIFGKLEVVRALADHIKNFEAKDKSDHTALYYANKYGHKQIADLLILKGSKADASWGQAWTPAELATAPREGEVSLYHLGHCGWAIRTTNHFMIFDYFPMAALPTDPSLANGHIVPAELKDLNVEVFITHEHTDHYNPVIFEWLPQIPNLTYIFGFRPEDLPENQRQGYAGQPYEYIGPRDNRTIDGMQIKTIKSNDAGVGFLVEVDGPKIFHAGDHAGWENGESEPYTSEIDYLASLVGTVDMAFINTTGCRFARDTLALQQSVFYALDKLSPQVVIPTHGLGREYVYREYAQKIRDHGYKTSILCADFLGDRFRFVKASL